MDRDTLSMYCKVGGVIFNLSSKDRGGSRKKMPEFLHGIPEGSRILRPICRRKETASSVQRLTIVRSTLSHDRPKLVPANWWE